MPDALDLATRYIAAWNERDDGRRRSLLAEGWTERASYTDPLMAGRGHEEIAALMAGVQRQFPQFRFALASRPDAHGKFARFSWHLGPDGEAPVVEGFDVLVLDGDRIDTVIGFIDAMPSAATGGV